MMTIAVGLLDDFQDLTESQQLDAMIKLKQLVIGNNNEKLKLLANPAHLVLLLNILQGSCHPTPHDLLLNTCIVMASITSLPSNQISSVQSLISLDRNIFNTLIENCRDLPLTHANLSILMNLVHVSANLVDCVTDENNTKMVRLVGALLAQSDVRELDLVIKAVNLVPFLANKLTLLNALLERMVAEFGSKHHLLMNSLFLAANDVFDGFTQETHFSIPTDFIEKILNLHTKSIQLRFSSFLLVVNLVEKSDLSYESKLAYHVQLLPSLVELSEMDNNCTFSLSTNDYPMKEQKLFVQDIHSLPLDTICKLCTKYPELIDNLVKFGISKVVLYLVVKNHNLIKLDDFRSINKVQLYSSYFLLLSCITSTKEIYRDDFYNVYKSINNDMDLNEERSITGIVNALLNEYCAKLERFNDTYHEPANSMVKAINFLNNDLFRNILYFLRSLSRSVALLRTFFYEKINLKTIKVLIKIAKINLNHENIFRLSKLGVENDSTLRFLNNQNQIKLLVFDIISNSIIEFSSIRDEILSEDIISIVSDYINLPSNENFNTNLSLIKLKCFSIIRNYIYEDTEESKKTAVQQVPLTVFFDHIITVEPTEMKLINFNILRNLTCDSEYFCKEIIEGFNAFIRNKIVPYSDFWGLLDYNLSTTNINTQLVSSINYIIDHMAAIKSNKYKDKIINQPSLLKKFHYYLKSTCHSDIKLSIIWIIINLTWRENLNYDSDDEFHEVRGSSVNRAHVLKKAGFVDAIEYMLKSLENDVNIDLLERGKTAKYQIVNLLDDDEDIE